MPRCRGGRSPDAVAGRAAARAGWGAGRDGEIAEGTSVAGDATAVARDGSRAVSAAERLGAAGIVVAASWRGIGLSLRSARGSPAPRSGTDVASRCCDAGRRGEPAAGPACLGDWGDRGELDDGSGRLCRSRAGAWPAGAALGTSVGVAGGRLTPIEDGSAAGAATAGTVMAVLVWRWAPRATWAGALRPARAVDISPREPRAGAGAVPCAAAMTAGVPGGRGSSSGTGARSGRAAERSPGGGGGEPGPACCRAAVTPGVSASDGAPWSPVAVAVAAGGWGDVRPDGADAGGVDSSRDPAAVQTFPPSGGVTRSAAGRRTVAHMWRGGRST